MWKLEHETRWEGVQGEMAQVSSGGHHVALQVIPVAAQGVQHQLVFLAVGKQSDLVVLAPAAKKLGGFMQRHFRLDETRVLRRDLAHPRFDLLQFGLDKWLAPTPPPG